MSNHTPGPWLIVERLKEHDYEIVAYNEKMQVCLVNMEEDAKLIAVAPELLEAVKQFLALEDERQPDLRTLGVAHRSALRMLIAKATSPSHS